jgi:hypothetical protein
MTIAVTDIVFSKDSGYSQTRSGHAAGFPPTLDFLAQDLDSIPYIHILQVKRCKSESHEIRSPKITDHVTRDEPLHQGVPLLVCEGYMASSPSDVSRRGERQFVPEPTGFDQFDEKL